MQNVVAVATKMKSVGSVVRIEYLAFVILHKTFLPCSVPSVSSVVNPFSYAYAAALRRE